jgi:UDP-N-acetylmuramoylalanine--D-glutamate ligase
MGQTGDIIEELVRKRGYESVYNFGTLEKIIENIVVKKNDIVLFSPAHSSFDQFANYVERGKEFKRLVLLKFNKKIDI